jgi:DNA polymerase-1
MGKKTKTGPHQPELAGFSGPDEPTTAAAPPGEVRLGETGQPAATDAATKSVNDAGQATGEDLRGQQVYVVDSHSLIYQVFHALPEMTGPAGQPAGAIHGFVRDMVDLISRKQPHFLVCAFDAPGDTFRHEIFDQYKINREAMPLDLQLQIPNVHRFLQAMGIPILSCPGYEADDILATVGRRVEQLHGECFLVTADKDCRQLITDQVKMYNIRKDQVIDQQTVRDEWGIEPNQVVDFQALWGDATDNIPGIPGIGKKTAAQLLAEFGTLEGIFDHVDQISGKKRRENIQQGHDAALLSRKLVKLTDQVPLELDWAEARVGNMDAAALTALCEEFGFRRMTEQLTALTEPAPTANWTAEYKTVDTPEKLGWLVGQLESQTRISVDTETTSTQARWAEIVGLSFAWQDHEAVYVPIRAPEGQTKLDPDTALRSLRPVLENPNIEKIGQNIKYDMVVLRSAGIRLGPVSFDTMVADYLLEPGQRSHSMDDLAKRYLQHETIKIRDLIGSGKNQKRMDEVSVEEVTPYAAEDALLPWQLTPRLDNRLRQEGLDHLFHTLEIPLIESLAEMEFNGISVDAQRLERLSHEAGQQIERLEQEIYDLAGGPFNIDSPKQLGKVLFEDLQLPVVKRTKTGASTDASVLSQLALQHELPAKIIEYRQSAKLKNTYMDALPKLVHPVTQRIHTSFKQDVAATGRLSSTEPNLQNIPVRTREGREIRAAFVPGDPQWRLLCADYSQIELRILAHCSQDQTLLDAFADGLDIHAQVASEVHRVGLEEVTADMRRQAKAINFGVIYGQSPFGLAKALGIPQSDAATFIEAYFSRYPGVDRFMRETLDACRGSGYVQTLQGRRRAVQGIRDAAAREGSRQRNLPERVAINTVIQGSAADLIKRAMIQVHRRLLADRFQARMLLQIHDELVFEAPHDQIEPLAEIVVQEMTSAGDLSVALRVDVKAGPNWLDCEPVPIAG